jgi:L-fucose mutarotase
VLRQRLLHPGILAALAAAGHGSTVLVADGNFPAATAPLPHVPRVYLNLEPDRFRVTDVLDVLLSAIPVELATFMSPDGRAGGRVPPVHDDLRHGLSPEIPTQVVGRTDFYALVHGTDLALVIATADTRPFANVLLTIGVRTT